MPLQPYRGGAFTQQFGRLSIAASRWLTQLVQDVNNRATSLGSVALINQNAAIVATAISTPVLTAALYRVSYSLRVTTAAGATSAVQLTLGWTSSGVAQTQAGANVNGNTTASQDNDSRIVKADAASTITYATTYASNPASAMLYELYVRVEKMPD